MKLGGATSQFTTKFRVAFSESSYTFDYIINYPKNVTLNPKEFVMDPIEVMERFLDKDETCPSTEIDVRMG